MVKISVLFFATFRDRAGQKSLTLELNEGANVADLKYQIVQEIPSLSGGLDSALVSINREFAFDADLLPVDAEVAFFPPVSGGVGKD